MMHVKTAGSISLKSVITLIMPQSGIAQFCGLKYGKWMGEKVLGKNVKRSGWRKHADESKPFYHMMPNATFKSKDEKWDGRRKPKNY